MARVNIPGTSLRVSIRHVGTRRNGGYRPIENFLACPAAVQRLALALRAKSAAPKTTDTNGADRQLRSLSPPYASRPSLQHSFHVKPYVLSYQNPVRVIRTFC